VIHQNFDGVMAFPKVYINGQLAGEWDYGYMSFRVDATSHVKFGETNIIPVQADTRQHGMRWYPGSGIYRKVQMIICEPIHIAHRGTFITTPEVNNARAVVEVRTDIENHQTSSEKVSIELIIYDPAGRQVTIRKSDLIIPAGNSKDLLQSLTIATPKRWDTSDPKLYSLHTIVNSSGKILEIHINAFGIRTFRFTQDEGFHLNDRRVQLYGVNLHHDQGPLGAAFYRRAMERQLEIMKEMGCDAIRTSHNPPSPEMLDLCDRMGFVVWDEVFDKWDDKADRLNGLSLNEFGEKQIRNFVNRDRNHPSVMLWSIRNEMSGLCLYKW
jgi:beta-galactosidase